MRTITYTYDETKPTNKDYLIAALTDSQIPLMMVVRPMNQWQSMTSIARILVIPIALIITRITSMIPKNTERVASGASWHGLTESTTHTRQMMVSGIEVSKNDKTRTVR